MRNIAQRLDIVDSCWLAPQAGDGWERRPRTRIRAFSLERAQHPSLFATHVPARADVQVHLEAIRRVQYVSAEIVSFVSFPDRFGNPSCGELVLSAKEHVRDVRARRISGDDHSFNELMRIAFK